MIPSPICLFCCWYCFRVCTFMVASAHRTIRSSNLRLYVQKRCRGAKANTGQHHAPLRCLHHIQGGIAHRCAAFTTSLNCIKASYAAVASEGADMEKSMFGTLELVILAKAL